MAHNITPGKPRHSGIPTPGRTTGIPTPGRLRSTSTAAQSVPFSAPDAEAIDRAFADAIKRNDPAQHQPNRTKDVSTSSLSPQAARFTISSGRRSEAGRPSSVASSSSTAGSALPKTPGRRPRTPSQRPQSRQSDVFGRSSSRGEWTYDVGDNVRIESLGFEGKLRYLGGIDDKPGLWAGVELSGGFAGKGKNDGSVNGKHYFTCPSKCGVFVATSKLSPPTVGAGALSRPSSVASSRSGRATPSFTNGRRTPSLSSGRITPGFTTPSTRTRLKGPTIQVSNASAQASALAQSKITAGSRASRYLGMTAKQLSSRDVDSTSPTRTSTHATSDASSGVLASPSRLRGSPFTTPRPPQAGRTSNIGSGVPSTTPSKGRQSLATPRARVPSAVAMPPPASPSNASASSRSVSVNDHVAKLLNNPTTNGTMVGTREPLPSSSLEASSRALQERVARLLSDKATASSPQISSRPDSSSSLHSGDEPIRVDGLITQLRGLEQDNELLRRDADSLMAQVSQLSSRIEGLQTERGSTLSRVSELEALVKVTERSLKEKESKMETYERSAQQNIMDLERVKNEGEARTKDIQSKLDDRELLVKSLKEALEAKEGAESRNDAVIQAKNAEIFLLEGRVQKAYVELEDERRELGGQVDELRHAGQETIALYEERLSAAEAQRYELEDTITSLEEQARSLARPSSPSSAANYSASAAQIDNETLREQVRHLQKKIGTLEDMLEDARATSEKEELLIQERIKRYKDKEELAKKELKDNRVLLEKAVKEEANARGRIVEIEEAFRESTVALENTRAEIERLRAEFANFDGLATDETSDKAAEFAHRVANERSRLHEEIAELKRQLEMSRSSRRQALEELEGVRIEAEEAIKSANGLRQIIETLDAEKAELEHISDDCQAKLTIERRLCAELRHAVDERTAELETARKNYNRDRPLNGNLQDSMGSTSPPPYSPSTVKHDAVTQKEEITGLKHIVQQLQKELLAVNQQNKLLESENRMLLSETDQLRDELKTLEDNVEQSLFRDEQVLDPEVPSAERTSANEILLQRDVKMKYEAELEQLRKKLAEVEIKSARTIHDLHKEVSELESLVEAKIYREDDLEREVDRLKDKLARGQKKSSKGSLEPAPGDIHLRVNSSQIGVSAPPSTAEVCEICEQPGHDIFSCHLLKEDSTGPVISRKDPPPPIISDDPSSLFCDECESHGHVAADCPHSMDVF